MSPPAADSDERRPIATGRVVERGSSNTARALWSDALGAALAARATELAEAALTPPSDAVEGALAGALASAAAAGQWAAVEALARELEARRRARAGVPSLEGARAKRGIPK